MKASKNYRKKRGLTSRGRRAALPSAPVRRRKALTAGRKRGGTKRRSKLTAGQKRFRARARARELRLRGNIGFAAFAGAARKGAKRRQLEAAEARGAAHAAAAAVKASRKERRQARRAGAKTSSLPRTPWSNGARSR